MSQIDPAPTARQRSIAIVSREIAPLVGGGIAPVVRAAGELLAERGWDVTFVTDAAKREAFDELQATGHQDGSTGARWVWVSAPNDHGDFTCWPHLWSARVDEALRAAFPDRAPDVIEFSDYLAEGFVTIQRRAARDPWLDHTTVCVRIHTSSEICSVLNGALSDQTPDAAMFEMERYCLWQADRVIAQCDEIYETYRRYYGERLAPRTIVRYALPGSTALRRDEYTRHAARARELVRPAGSQLHLLYLGRAERRKGIVELAEALARRPDLDLSLSIVGGDTVTGPLGGSVREHLQYLADADPRIRVLEQVPPDEVPVLVGKADAVVTPSRWECWPNVALETLQIGRPVLATPVGGLSEMIRPGVNGLHAAGGQPEDLEALLEKAVARRDELRRMPRSAAFRDHLEQLTALEPIVGQYTELADRPAGTPATGARNVAQPLVSVVIPYFRLDGTLEATLRTLAAQVHRALDVLIINDGSLRHEDRAAFDLAATFGARIVTIPNCGLSGARNAGLTLSEAPYVCMLDADDELDPRFISACVRALEHDRSLAYATTWVRYVDENSVPHEDPDNVRGYFPFGNWTDMMDRLNLAGVCTSVIRRSALEQPTPLRYDTRLASYEDWDLYRQLALRGRYGVVLPERWFHYRVRPDSMTRQDARPNVLRLTQELRAADRFRRTTWTKPTPGVPV